MEPMSAAAVFNVQTVLSLVVFFVTAKWIVMPWLLTLGPNDALVPLLLFSALRLMGASLMVPALTQGLQSEFAVTAGYGDLAVGILALLAAIVLKMGLPFGTILAWVYAVAGALDFVNAARISGSADLPNHAGSLWYLLAVGGPAWMITIVFIIRLLIWPAPAKRA